jgi:two-component system, LytTR family, sensor histidine kinase AlgZ
MPKLLGSVKCSKKTSLILFILGLLLFIVAGSLASQALLLITGFSRADHFWAKYFHSMSQIVPLAAIFIAGIVFYAWIRERLQDAEAMLKEKQLAEERMKKSLMEARLRSLESRLNPHFLFNTLNTISSLIVENPALAEQTVGRLAALLRFSLDVANQSMIPLSQELTMVQDYFEIEKARFGDRFLGRIEAPEELRQFQVPSLSILSLVENSLKHGISSKTSGGECIIIASMQMPDNRLSIEVCDNGPGFDLASIPEGHGLENLVERLEALFGEKGRLNVFRRDGWCVVKMDFPIL